MRLNSVLLLIFSALSSVGFSQSTLLINEVSQGSSGAKEYVELVVAGVPPSGCNGTTPTMDLRGIVIDDNNGAFGSGSGQGIATGALRFSNSNFWSAIPQGTIIVIYNENDREASIPPDDASMSDGNARLILPADSPLLEGSVTSPSTSNQNYQANANWSAGNGSWNSVGLANGGDCMQVRQSISATSAMHSVGFGSISNPVTSVYFAQAGAAMVYFCNNSPITSGWSVGTAASNQTPGLPNNALNAAYIQSFTTQSGNSGLQVSIAKTEETCLNACDASLTSTVTGGATPYSYSWNTGANTANLSNRCAGSYSVTVTDNNGCTGNASMTINGAMPIQVNATKTNESCQNSCDGTAAVQISGGASPYSVSWSNTSTGTSISALCPGNYTATVIDNNGCQATSSATIAAGATLGSADFITTGPFGVNDPAVQLQNQTAGGTYTTSDCSGCLTSNGIFSPQLAGQGSYNICYTLTNQACSVTECATFVVGGCTPQTTSENMMICPGDSALIYGNWENTANTYSQTYTGANGCDSTHSIVLSFFVANSVEAVYDLCLGDSIFVNGIWIDTAGIFPFEHQTVNGCMYYEIIKVVQKDCDNEFNLYIPNVFTPNGDNTNDLFKIELSGALIIEGYIFNRWGNVVAEFSETQNSWDGRSPNGEMSLDGVYTYMVRYAKAGGNAEVAQGHVTLIR